MQFEINFMLPIIDMPSDCLFLLSLQSRYRSTTLVLSPSLLSLCLSVYTPECKHNVNEHINVVHPHVASGWCSSFMPLDRPLHSNAEWFARIVVTVGLMEIGLRIRRSFFPRLALTSPLIFCDWWKSWMVDNFAFNKRHIVDIEALSSHGEKKKEYLVFCDR